MEDNRQLRIQLWDIAGQERFGNMTRVYYKETTVGVIVFDVNLPNTFTSIDKWAQDIRTKWTSPFPLVLVGYWCVCPNSNSISPSQAQETALAEGFHGYYEVGEDGTGVDKLLAGIVALSVKML
uniref:Ras-related protein Rab n=1 Tax=Arcella intermedia TaxID=1963864 RepID=A0A6B2LLX8_9EUKA